MARNLPAIAFVRFLQSETRRPRFVRRRRTAFRRRGHGAVFRRHSHGSGFSRYGQRNIIRRRSGFGGRCRFFNWNRRRHGGRRHSSNPRQAYAPRIGQGAQAAAENAQGIQAAPAAPPSPPAPLPPAFHIPPMDWLLGGPAAPFLGEEDDFDAALAPPPYPAYFPSAVFNPPSPTPSAELVEYEFPPGYGPEADAYMDLPTLTPTLSDEDPEHFMPPGYGPVPELKSPPPAEETGAPSAAAPFAFDLNIKVEPEEEEAFVAAEASPPTPPAQAPPPAGPSTPPPEARRLLRRFAMAMASRQPGFRVGTWEPASLGFPNGVVPNTRLPDGSLDEEERGGSTSRR